MTTLKKNKGTVLRIWECNAKEMRRGTREVTAGRAGEKSHVQKSTYVTSFVYKWRQSQTFN
jgi:hypothetical protein